MQSSRWKERKPNTDKEKAEALNNFFTSVFTRECTTNIPHLQERTIEEPLQDLAITEDSVMKKLQALNPAKSPGTDGMHPKVLKELCPAISKPLAIIMSKSLEEGYLPESWKSANVTPIYKKGKKNDCGNYRPVSLTSILCKTLEGLIRTHVMKHIDRNNLLSPCQHGFVEGRSCSTQFLHCLDVWMEKLDEGSRLDVIYLDFAKAFDSIPNQRLLHKLEMYGLTNKIIKWSECFLTGRKQRVIINGEQSTWTEVLSGVPQGSVLGPLFFILFINDMPDVVDNYIALFADAKLFSTISNEDDHSALQQDLSSLRK